jgi:hypothetical protein
LFLFILGYQEQHYFIQEKLLQTITENQELKKYLDNMMQKQKLSLNQSDNQLVKIRNVIE